MSAIAYLQVAQLRELLPTIIELASEWLDLLVNDLVGAYVAALCKSLAADVTAVGTLACVASLMGLLKLARVSEVTKGYLPSSYQAVRSVDHKKVLYRPGIVSGRKLTQRKAAYEWLCSSMCANMNL